MKVVATSDIHGNFPTIPECDLLLIAGDICPDYPNGGQLAWLNDEFSPWTESIPAKETIVIAGNHDFVFEDASEDILTWLTENWPWSYLQDSSMEWDGMNVYGTPWQPEYFDWAFNLPRDDDEAALKEKFDLIPNETDILIAHGPPYTFGDYTEAGTGGLYPIGNVGSHALLEAVDRVQPQLTVFGHIHNGYGAWRYKDEMVLANVAASDNRNMLHNDRHPLTFEF